MKSDVELFSRLYTRCQTRDGNLEDSFSMRTKHGHQRSATEEDYDLVPRASSCQDIWWICPADIHPIHFFSAAECGTCGPRLGYLQGWLPERHNKNQARKGCKKTFGWEGAVPGNWQNFLRADSNKTELFNFLSKFLHQAFCKEDKEVVLTDGKEPLSAQLLQDVHILAPCSHEEADSRMLLHVSHAAKDGHNQMLIRTDWLGGWRQKESMSHTALHCHKHQIHATSWSHVVARVDAESAAGARWLHFSAHASASVREKAPADSKISRVLKH